MEDTLKEQYREDGCCLVVGFVKVRLGLLIVMGMTVGRDCARSAKPLVAE